MAEQNNYGQTEETPTSGLLHSVEPLRGDAETRLAQDRNDSDSGGGALGGLLGDSDGSDSTTSGDTDGSDVLGDGTDLGSTDTGETTDMLGLDTDRGAGAGDTDSSDSTSDTDGSDLIGDTDSSDRR